MGHPIVFPNILKTTGFQYRIPIDDNNTYHWWFFPHLLPDGAEHKPQDEIPYYDVPLPMVDEKGNKPWSVLDNNGGQDIMMWITQGFVSDRSLEKLGASDVGIVRYRQLLKDNLEAIARGEEPMNVFRTPEENVYHELPSEYWEMGLARAREGQYSRSGGASKYSPVIADAMRKAGKEEALTGPVF
jgi:5,5'-dehydrodivanillate O-demethylase